MPEDTLQDTEATETVAGGNEQQATQATESVEQLKQQIADLENHKRALNRENAERRAKLSAYEKAEAEKKNAELSELEKASKERDELKAHLAELETKTRNYERERSFEKAVRELKISFVNDFAREDTMRDLPADVDPADSDAIKAALVEIKKQKSYRFATQQQAEKTDAEKKGGSKPGEITDAQKAEVARRFNLRS